MTIHRYTVIHDNIGRCDEFTHYNEINRMNKIIHITEDNEISNENSAINNVLLFAIFWCVMFMGTLLL